MLKVKLPKHEEIDILRLFQKIVIGLMQESLLRHEHLKLLMQLLLLQERLQLKFICCHFVLFSQAKIIL